MDLATSKFAPFGWCLALTAALVGCGSDDSETVSEAPSPNESAQENARGSAAVFLTDAPAETGVFKAVNANIGGISLKTEKGDTVAAREDEVTTVDLLDFQHDAIPISYGEGVPEGRYCSIILQVNSLDLVLAEDDTTVSTELPADGTLELVPDECFDVAADSVVQVQLDLDIGKSIYEEDGSYVVRPLFYVDVITEGEEARMVRLKGKVIDSEPDNNRVLLCEAMPVYREEGDRPHSGCAWVAVNEDTGLFDNVNHSGEPRPLEELYLSETLGTQATISGAVGEFEHGYLDINIPEGQTPPPDECKLWYPDRPPGQQPAPEPCDDVMASAPNDTVVIDHNGHIVLDRRGLMTLNAVAVELGEVLQLDGHVSALPSEGQFSMTVEPGEAVDSADPLSVALQEAPAGGNGTRVVSIGGNLMSASDMMLDQSVSAGGVLSLSSESGNSLRSSVIVLNDGLVSEQRISGNVMSFDTEGLIISVLDPESTDCGESTGDVMVEFTDNTAWFTLSLSDEESLSMMGGELEGDQQIEVYGACSSGSFEATQVVIFNDQRTDA